MDREKVIRKRMRIAGATLLSTAVIFGAGGFIAGKSLVKPQILTVTKEEPVTVYKPVYINQDTPPERKISIVYRDVPLSHNLQDYIYEICHDEGVPVALVYAVIEHESGFNADAVSETDDYGLMQINKINHGWLLEEYRAEDMLDPYQNVYCGVKILGEMLKTYGDEGKALTAYALGEGGASELWQSGTAVCRAAQEILDLKAGYEV